MVSKIEGSVKEKGWRVGHCLRWSEIGYTGSGLKKVVWHGSGAQYRNSENVQTAK